MKYNRLRVPTVFASSILLLNSPAYSQSENTTEADKKGPVFEEIKVTAQRRSTNLEDTPISVTVVDGEDLAAYRVENVSSISSITPSIQFSSSNAAQSSANLVIRGIGTNGNSRTFEGGVGVIVDGVYRTRAGSILETFLDIDSVQALRGPQGTLFGKNTTAGVILLDSAKPDMVENKGIFALGYGNYSAVDLKIGYNFALSDSSALRIVGLYDSTDGFYNTPNMDGEMNKETKAVKINYLTQVNDQFEIQIIADLLESDGQCCYAVSRLEDQTGGVMGDLVDSIAASRGETIPSRNLEDFEAGLNSPSFQDVTDQGVTLKMQYETDSGTFDSVTAYRNYEVDQIDADADFGVMDFMSLDESFYSNFFSQEITYSTDFEAVNGDVVFGIYYSTEDIDARRDLGWGVDAQVYWTNLLAPSLGLPSEVIDTFIKAPAGTISKEILYATNDSIALFTHGVFKLNNAVDLTVGFRWSQDDKTAGYENLFYDYQLGESPLYSDSYGPRNPFTVLGISPGPDYSDSFKDDAISGNLGIQYRLNKNLMMYATYSRGFKSGGVNMDNNAAGIAANNPDVVGDAAAPLTSPIFESETMETYELGMKGTYWGGRARTNFAAFYNDLENFQVATFLGLQYAVFNSPSAESYGAEVENSFLINDILSLNIDAIWLPKAEYGIDEDLPDSLSGQRFKFAPKLSSNVALDLQAPLNSNYDIQGRIQYQYRSSQYIGTPVMSQSDSLGTINLNLGLYSLDAGWVVELWVRNATDETYETVAFPSPLQTGLIDTYLGAPRTFGVNFRGEF